MGADQELHLTVAEWEPFQMAEPVEWRLVYSVRPYDPIGLIRRLEFGPSWKPEVWYRAVTFSSDPAGRELVGYARTAEHAARLLWERMLEDSRAQSLRAGSRQDERGERNAGGPTHSVPRRVERD